MKIDAQPNMLRFANIELTLSDEAERLWLAVCPAGEELVRKSVSSSEAGTGSHF